MASREGAALLPGDGSAVGNPPSPSHGCGKGELLLSSPFQLSHREPGSKKIQLHRQSLGVWISHSVLGRGAGGLRQVLTASCVSRTGDAEACELKDGQTVAGRATAVLYPPDARAASALASRGARLQGKSCLLDANIPPAAARGAELLPQIEHASGGKNTALVWHLIRYLPGRKES